jgi:uncharacterized protein YdhG (YjbR/CyaY superfamily)
MNKQIDAYIKKQKSPQKETCQRLREIIFATFPKIEEEIKWGVPSYASGMFYIVALKDHVNLGFSMENLSESERKGFEGSGKTMKVISVGSVQEINEKDIVEKLKLVWERTGHS